MALNGKCPRFHVDNVGTTPAALATYLTVTTLKPDLVITAGTAGGFQRQGGVIGDVYLASGICHHDRRIPLPGFDNYGFGSHCAAKSINLAKHLECKVGVCTTSNSLDHTEKDDEVMIANDASIKEMEAAAVAWVCEQVKVPMIAVKVITDIVDAGKPSHEQFLDNLATAALTLQATLPKVIDFISGKSLAEL